MSPSPEAQGCAISTALVVGAHRRDVISNCSQQWNSFDRTTIIFIENDKATQDGK